MFIDADISLFMPINSVRLDGLLLVSTFMDLPKIPCASSEGFYETARKRRIVKAFAARIRDKHQISRIFQDLQAARLKLTTNDYTAIDLCKSDFRLFF